MMSNRWEGRHALQEVAKNADQVELRAIQQGSAIFDTGVRDERVADALDDYEIFAPDQPSWMKDSLATDEAVSEIAEVIRERQTLLGNLYPFSVQNSQLEYNASSNKVYEFCLGVALSKSITAGSHVSIPREFEQLSVKIVEHYLGPYATSMHFGFPRENGSRFKDACDELHGKCNEWQWGPQEQFPDDPTLKAIKDGGLDFAAWKQAPDQRFIGQLFVVGQCACGNDWNTKLHEPSMRRLATWLRRTPSVEPVRAFTTPISLVTPMLHSVCAEHNLLIFDRVRIVKVAETMDVPPEEIAKYEQLIELAQKKPEKKAA